MKCNRLKCNRNLGKGKTKYCSTECNKKDMHSYSLAKPIDNKILPVLLLEDKLVEN